MKAKTGEKKEKRGEQKGGGENNGTSVDGPARPLRAQGKRLSTVKR